MTKPRKRVNKLLEAMQKYIIGVNIDELKRYERISTALTRSRRLRIHMGPETFHSPSRQLCSRCNAIIGESQTQARSHLPTFFQMQQDAKDGCYICSWLVAAVQQDTVADPHAEPVAGHPATDAFSTYEITETYSIRSQNFRCSGAIGNCKVVKSASFSFTVSPLDGTESGEMHMRWDKFFRPRENDGIRNLQVETTGHPEVAKRAKAWLRICEGEHRSCGTHFDNTFAPPRVLEIDGDTVRLREMGPGKGIGRYVALSYCWGKEQLKVRLGDTTEDRLKGGIPVQQLDLTLQHSIEFSREMGFHHIWIDSLCIKQFGEESAADWQKHVKVMRNIYWNCTVCLVAGRASSADDGCYVSRNVASLEPCLVSWPTRLYKETRHAIVPQGLFRSSIEHLPTSARSWILQEEMLSPRSIVFGTEEIHWRCSVLEHASERFPSGVPNSRPALWAIRDIWAKGDEVEDRMLREWDRIVHNYMQRGITKHEDRLPAIAGIAELISVRWKDQYAAGFFRRTLPLSLLWTTQHGRAHPATAPSWSWASAIGPIEMSSSLSSGYTIRASVVDIDLSHQDPDTPFGRILRGQIRLRGPVFWISWKRPLQPTMLLKRHTPWLQEGEPQDRTQAVSCGLKRMRDFDIELWFDDKENSLDDPNNVVGLALTGGKKEAKGILLRCCEKETGHFVRIGTFKIEAFRLALGRISRQISIL
jgi:hypothetical protein